MINVNYGTSMVDLFGMSIFVAYNHQSLSECHPRRRNRLHLE